MITVPPMVTGQVIFTTNVPAFVNATIHVQLEDFSRADVGALLLAEEVISHIKHKPGSDQSKSTIVYFEITCKEGESIDPRNFYGIRVWVDIDNDGRNGSGDLNSDQSYRVLTQGFGNSVEVKF